MIDKKNEVALVSETSEEVSHTEKEKSRRKIQTVDIHGKAYVPVAERVRLVHEDLKEVSITTEILPVEGAVVVKATVITPKGTFTGISAANPAKLIEKTSPYEVAETSAVGRALGFAGYGIIDSIATAEEMSKAIPQKDPAWINEEMPNEKLEKKVCSQHGEPVVMFGGVSKSTGKEYWWHKNEKGQVCFGSGWQA